MEFQILGQGKRYSKAVSLAGCLTALLVAGCGHMRTASNGSREVAQSETPKSLKEVLQENIEGKKTYPMNAIVQSGEDILIRGTKLKNTQFDIPITINSRVEQWIDYFTGRGRPHFEKYLERSEFFIPYINPLLKQNGLPSDLVYLAMIESGFNNHARSRAKAVGPWQFISATGKRYGLMVNWWVDERRDIRKSTLAAVEYLRDLYQMFQSWELAAAAYNSGEAKIARAVRRFGTKDFWVISRHRFLRPETRDYVPKIIAAAIISKNREQFGFPVVKTKPAADEAIAGDGEIVKVIKTERPEDDLSEPNPEASASNDSDSDEDTVESKPGVSPATLTVPAEPTPGSDGQVAKNDSMPLAKPVPTPHVTRNGQVGGEELAEFEVRSPADLLKVARAAGLSYQTVKSLNPELIRWCTPPNVSSYRLRLPSSTKDRFLATYNGAAYPRQVEFLTYKARNGDTLSRVARQFGIKVDPISDLNGLSPRMPLKMGSRILLPLPNDRSRTLASLDVRDPPERKRYRKRSRRGSSSRIYKISYKRREAAREVRRGDSGT